MNYLSEILVSFFVGRFFPLSDDPAIGGGRTQPPDGESGGGNGGVTRGPTASCGRNEGGLLGSRFW